MFDTFIVGGGAAGLATAVMLKQKAPKLNIALAEQLDRVGKKISITGNGRCNISNRNIEKNKYHSFSVDKAFKILSDFSTEDAGRFFSNLGVEFYFEENKAFPRSFQASSVVDVLRFEADKLNVSTFLSEQIKSITKDGDYFNILTENSVFKAKSVVIATGGLAGGSKLGSMGDGYLFLKKFDHKILPQLPVIVQVKTENNITKSLKGIKVNAAVTVTSDNGLIAFDFGEVLFCDYGLSGPPVLQLSRYCKSGTVIHLDLFSDTAFDTLLNLITKRKEIFKSLPLTEFFAGLLHKRVGQAIIKACDLSLSNTADSLTYVDCEKIVKTLKDFSFNVTGNTGFINAQATSGGAALTDFNDVLMSKKCSGLFAAGEVLDVDGDCGGYNLQWAWSSAAAVSKGIIIYLSEKTL